MEPTVRWRVKLDGALVLEPNWLNVAGVREDVLFDVFTAEDGVTTIRPLPPELPAGNDTSAD